MNKGYIISWKSKVTGKRDNGIVKFSFDVANKICHKLNIQFDEINHYEVFEGK